MKRAAIGIKSGLHRIFQDFITAAMLHAAAVSRIPICTTLTAQVPVDQLTRTPAMRTAARTITNGRVLFWDVGLKLGIRSGSYYKGSTHWPTTVVSRSRLL